MDIACVKANPNTYRQLWKESNSLESEDHVFAILELTDWGRPKEKSQHRI